MGSLLLAKFCGFCVSVLVAGLSVGVLKRDLAVSIEMWETVKERNCIFPFGMPGP